MTRGRHVARATTNQTPAPPRRGSGTRSSGTGRAQGGAFASAGAAGRAVATGEGAAAALGGLGRNVAPHLGQRTAFPSGGAAPRRAAPQAGQVRLAGMVFLPACGAADRSASRPSAPAAERPRPSTVALP